MTVLSASDYALIETKPHTTDLYLSIYDPPIVFAAQVNDVSIAKGARTITYDTVTAGSYTLIEADFTLLVGTTAGGNEKGSLRVKSANATTLTVPANSSINWADGDYLTVLRYVEIRPMYQRIIKDPANAENTIWYKDYDVAYTDQNSVLGTLMCMGGNFAGFLDGGKCDVVYSVTGTHNVNDEVVTYNWFLQGASVTGSSSALFTGTYTIPGHYMTRRIDTNASGGTDTSYRFISIYNRPGEGNSLPVLRWEFVDLSGSRDSGGYRGRVRVYSDADKSKIVNGALVVIFTDDWYGSTKKSIGGNAHGRSSIFFSGYISKGSITYNYKQGYVEFEVVSPSEIMRSMEAFAVDVTSSTNPTAQSASDPNYPSGWNLILTMDCEKAIYHYLKWHSTVLKCCDIEFRGTDQAIEHFTADKTSLYDSINTLMDGTLVGKVVCDRQGKIWNEIEAMGTNNAASAFPTSMYLNKTHWVDQPNIEERTFREVSYLEMGGIQYNGPVLGTFSAFLACAPGVEPDFSGKMEEKQGLALASQAQLNTLVGNIFAWKNSQYPQIDYRLGGNYRQLEIAPQELVSITMLATDTPRGIAFTNKVFAERGMSWNYDPKRKALRPTLNVAEVTQGFDGDTIDIPDVPPTDGYDVPPKTVPPVSTSVTPTSAVSLMIYDEHLLISTGTAVNALDFVGLPIQASITGSFAFINVFIPVYHNDVFVGNAGALNFLDANYTGTFV